MANSNKEAQTPKSGSIVLTQEQIQALTGGKVMTAAEISVLLNTAVKRADQRRVMNRCKARATLALIKANRPAYKTLLAAEYKKEGVVVKTAA